MQNKIQKRTGASSINSIFPISATNFDTLIVALLVVAAQAAQAVTVSPSEMAEARRWAAAMFEGTTANAGQPGLPMAGGPAVADPNNPPFSFIYDGQPSARFLKKLEIGTGLKAARPATDPTDSYLYRSKTGLVVRAVGIEYHDFPTVEWTLYLKNPGTAATPNR